MLEEGDIELFSNPLKLRKNKENDYFQSNLSITNKSNNYVIFKIYINQKSSSYKVHPTTSFLKPKSQINVNVRKYNKEEQNENLNDKFLIRFFSINKVVESIEEAKLMIKNKNYNEEDKYEEVVNLIINNENNDELELNNKFNKDFLDDNELKEFDIDQAISSYEKMNNNLKNQINNIEKAIENIENELQNIRINNNGLKNQKDNSLKINEKENKGLNKTFTLFLILICFVFGGYISKVKNKFFLSVK